jgi:sec-independent protein translocase protein TatA
MGKIEELLIVLLIILLLFGAKRIPELARNIGQSMREVRKGFNGDVNDEPVKTETKKKADKTK